jgi:hypothetical protein
MPDHGASAFESEAAERHALQCMSDPRLQAIGIVSRPILLAPNLSRGAATMSGRRARTVRSGRGEQVSRRRATVSNVAERAEGKKVEGRDAA